MPPLVQPPTWKRTTTKRVREYDVVVSDRIRLVEAANEFVAQMVNKQVLPTIGSGVLHVDVALSENETHTLNAALDFLRRQFESGYSTTEPHEKRIEIEETVEY